MTIGAEPQIGAELSGYRVERLLGRGGMGVVYLAHDLRLKRNVALKLLAPELSGDERFRERFLRESELAASLDHENVIPIYQAGEHEGRLFIAMRYVEGTDLAELLREGPLEPTRAVAILAQVASALDAAHARGLVHRDVKPSNILLAANEHAYLADFGLTRSGGTSGPTAEYASSLGTVDYVAPEQIDGDALDARTDVYSLACVLYQTLTGTLPYPADTSMGVMWSHLQADPPSAHKVRPELPEALDPILARGLAKEPDQRQDTCGDLVDDARHALGIGRRSRRLALAGAVVLIALAAALGVALIQRGGGEAGPDTTPTTAVTVDSLQHIDPATNTLVATIRGLARPTAVSAGNGAVWVTNTDGEARWFDPKTNTELGSTAIGAGSRNVLATGGGVWVVSDRYDLIRLDPSDGHLLWRLTPDSSGGVLYLAYADGALFGAIPCVCGAPIADQPGIVKIPERTLEGAASPTFERSEILSLKATDIAAGGGSVWVASDEVVFSELLRVPTSSVLSPEQHITIEGGALAVAYGEGSVWVANTYEDTVSRIDPASGAVVSRIAVGDDPIDLAVGYGSVWVANRSDGTVSRIDPATNRVVATTTVGPHPGHLAAGEGGVWVTVQP